MASENRKPKTKQVFPLAALKPTLEALASLVLFNSSDKTCFSHIALHRCRESSLHRTRASPPNLESVRFTKLRVLTGKFEGRTWSVSRGLAWDVGA